jgi:hydroxyacylglutathione hydrolase
MLLHQRFVPGLAIASYIVGDEKTGEAAVIDPTRDVGDYLRYAEDHVLRIRHVVETHVHADFVSGSRELKARLDGEPVVHCSAYGGADWTQPYADRSFKEGDTIPLGSVRLGCLHTPGHTPEHITVTLTDAARSADVPWLMFTGDFLFVGDVGRPDLLGEEAQRELARHLYRSLFEKLPAVPDFTEVFPAHGAGSLCGKAIGSRRSSTVGYRRRFDPALAKKPREQWVGDLISGMPLAPPYYRRMKKVNREGPVLGPELPGQKRWSAKQVYEQTCDGCLILDVRSKETFGEGGAHMIPSVYPEKGSVNRDSFRFLQEIDKDCHEQRYITETRRPGQRERNRKPGVILTVLVTFTTGLPE